MSDKQQSSAKVFVGGLSWETTDEKLRRYFENYGAVQEAFVSYDRHTGRPRGFGFVVFADSAVADKVISQQHTIDRREVEAKRALPKDESPVSKDQQAAANGHRTKKIFVGGLPPTVDDETFRTYFGEFGEVDDAVVMYDHENKRPRGFGFITFTEEEAVEKVFAQGTVHSIHDKQVEIKRAVPRDCMPPSPRSAYRAHSGYGGPPPPPAHYYGGPPERPPPYGDRWPGDRWAERGPPHGGYGGPPPGRGGRGYGSPHHGGPGGGYAAPPYGGYSGRGGGRGGAHPPHGGYAAPPPPPPAVVTGIPATGLPAGMGGATPEAALAAAINTMATPGAMTTPGGMQAAGAMSTPMSAVMQGAGGAAAGATPMGIHTPSPLQTQLVQGFSSLSNGVQAANLQAAAAAAQPGAQGYSMSAAAAAALDAQQQAVAAQTFADAMQQHASSLGGALSQHLQQQQQQAAAAAAIWS